MWMARSLRIWRCSDKSKFIKQFFVWRGVFCFMNSFREQQWKQKNVKLCLLPYPTLSTYRNVTVPGKYVHTSSPPYCFRQLISWYVLESQNDSNTKSLWWVWNRNNMVVLSFYLFHQPKFNFHILTCNIFFAPSCDVIRSSYTFTFLLIFQSKRPKINYLSRHTGYSHHLFIIEIIARILSMNGTSPWWPSSQQR